MLNNFLVSCIWTDSTFVQGACIVRTKFLLWNVYPSASQSLMDHNVTVSSQSTMCLPASCRS